MQTYGMILSDSGNIALTARADRGTTAKWAGLLGTTDLIDLQVTDFEVVDGGPRIAQGECVRQGPVASVPMMGIQGFIALCSLLFCMAFLAAMDRRRSVF